LRWTIYIHLKRPKKENSIMPQTPADYSQVVHNLAVWVNAITIRQKASEIALKTAGVTDEVWKAALGEATASIGWAVLPESNTKTLEDFLAKMQGKLSDS
jgi:hypothetical protein